MLTKELQEKLDRLKAEIGKLGSLAVGFSGGVDSSFLLFVAHEVLKERALAVTAVDASMPERELKEAKAFCEKYGIAQVIVPGDPMQEEAYRNNTPDRCYFCKRGIFSQIKEIAKENGIDHVAEGSNVDDLQDYRPGLRAIEELLVVSPLRQAGLCKDDIREI